MNWKGAITACVGILSFAAIVITITLSVAYVDLRSNEQRARAEELKNECQARAEELKNARQTALVEKIIESDGRVVIFNSPMP